MSSFQGQRCFSLATETTNYSCQTDVQLNDMTQGPVSVTFYRSIRPLLESGGMSSFQGQQCFCLERRKKICLCLSSFDSLCKFLLWVEVALSEKLRTAACGCCLAIISNSAERYTFCFNSKCPCEVFSLGVWTRARTKGKSELMIVLALFSRFVLLFYKKKKTVKKTVKSNSPD